MKANTLALMGCLTIAAACAGGGHGNAPSRRAAAPRERSEPALDRLTEGLVAQLPTGADRCSAGRPAALTREQRALMAQVSTATELVWAPELKVDAFAVATRRRRGHVSRVTVMHGPLGPAEWRAALEAHSGLTLRFEPGPRRCDPDACPVAVRFVGPHTVVLERGEWLSVPGALGAEQACAQLLRRHPGAVEVLARRGDTRADGMLLPILRSTGFVERGATRLRALRTDVLATPEVAEATVAARLTRPLLAWSGGPPPGVVGQVRRRAEGDRVITELLVDWEELALLSADREREEAAAGYATALARMRPDDRVDVTQLEPLLQQVHYRMEALEHSGAGDDRPMASSLRDLLERGLAEHPERRDLARLLARVLLERLDAGADAVSLARRMARQDGVDQSFWAQVERHGLARSDPSALARKLREHGMAREVNARAMADDVLSALGAGASFDDAERAALADQVLRRRPSLVAGEELPSAGPADLLEALFILARLADDAPWLWLRIDGLPKALSAPGLLRLSGGGHDRALAVFERDDTGGVRALGAALAHAPAGPIGLRLALGHDDGPLERVVAFEGGLAGGMLHLQRSDPTTAALPWGQLSRSLVGPLGRVGRGRLNVPIPEGASGRRMQELAEGAFGLVCIVRSGTLSCATGHHGDDHVRAALAAMMAQPFGAHARLLFQ